MSEEIGDIWNYYGGLHVKESGGKYFWSIENYTGHNWEEISGELYRQLLKHNKEKTK